jgi:dTDP-4-dehydrorhamnose reductase
MKMLLLGCNGQVGWELRRALSPLGELVALDRRGAPARSGASRVPLCGDLTNAGGIVETVEVLQPDVIINAAAYTAVDKAESEPELAHAVNAAAPGALATVARYTGAALVHFSTDYVFDGCGDEPRDEAAVPAPLSVYGRTKLEGEERVRASGCSHLILRTSWVYAARGSNFLRTILRLAQERTQLRVIDDQVGAPTGAELIADTTAHAIRALRRDERLAGTYHLAAAGYTSWHGYAVHAIESARSLGVPLKVDPVRIAAIPSTEYKTHAQRPRNSRLAIGKLERSFDLRMPPWQAGVERTLREWYAGA